MFLSTDLSVSAVTCLPIRLTPSLMPPPVLMPTRAASRSLVTSCCSTPVIWVIWLVIWVVSVGASGSWFFSWVVSSFRKVCSLLASEFRELLILSRVELLVAATAMTVSPRF